MRSLRINGTNAHDIQIQNSVDIYKRLILNHNHKLNHNFHVFFNRQNITNRRIVIPNQNKIF